MEAVGVTYTHPNWYLSAWCHLRGSYRIFRLDRIEQIKVTANAHTKTHPSLESLLGNDEPQCLQKVVLRTSKEAAKRNADRCYFMGMTAEEELENGEVEQTYMTYSLEAMARWALANADTTTVVSPDEIRDIIKQIIKHLEL